jgi:hypothetical protein
MMAAGTLAAAPAIVASGQGCFTNLVFMTTPFFSRINLATGEVLERRMDVT